MNLEAGAEVQVLFSAIKPVQTERRQHRFMDLVFVKIPSSVKLGFAGIACNAFEDCIWLTLRTGNPQEPLMKKPGKVPKAAKAKKKDQKGADQTDQTEAPEGEAIKQEQRPTSAPAAAAVVAAEVPKVKPIRLLLKCASSSGGQQDGPPATSSEAFVVGVAATRMDVVDLNESRPQPSERPKWKKLLQRGKGGQRLDVQRSEDQDQVSTSAQRQPQRGCFWESAWYQSTADKAGEAQGHGVAALPEGKRKTPEEDGQQPVQSKAEKGC
ncbi:unnamed protein product [Durusdinium trenchii]|uniref:Uncharacterized protein n=1 Tax=Durusdinium trenchii TaxID=1381693 RepID=A0ABP0NUI7_9DINO